MNHTYIFYTTFACILIFFMCIFHNYENAAELVALESRICFGLQSSIFLNKFPRLFRLRSPTFRHNAHALQLNRRPVECYKHSKSATLDLRSCANKYLVDIWDWVFHFHSYFYFHFYLYFGQAEFGSKRKRKCKERKKCQGNCGRVLSEEHCKHGKQELLPGNRLN